RRLIAEEFANCGFPGPSDFVHSALKQGKLLILLDGLDEVPTTKNDPVLADKIEGAAPARELRDLILRDLGLGDQEAR
ncbi:MAG: hypothetical protein AAGK22_27435, partial [Acidobacteriota bacterium]